MEKGRAALADKPLDPTSTETVFRELMYQVWQASTPESQTDGGVLLSKEMERLVEDPSAAETSGLEEESFFELQHEDVLLVRQALDSLGTNWQGFPAARGLLPCNVTLWAGAYSHLVEAMQLLPSRPI